MCHGHSYFIILRMTKRSRLSRITITLPTALLQAADKLAKQLDRSRSWVVAEGLRKFTGGTEVLRSAQDRVAEETRVPYRAIGLGEYRRQQLEADLKLTPEERIRAAEQLTRLATRMRPPRKTNRIIAFDSYEEYADWKEREGRIL